MCLILFSFNKHADIPLILAANRDEFFQRPSAPAQYWKENPNVLAGQDLVGLGTWLGITKEGKFAAVTNVREPNIVVENPLSRGELTRDYLTSHLSPEKYIESIEANKMRYSGFNLLVGEFRPNNNKLLYISNRQENVAELDSGTYGLSNHLLNTDWPKVKAGKDFINNNTSTDVEHIHQLEYHENLRQYLENPGLADDEQLPNTGIAYEREKALSAAFIVLPDYGTRTSTILTVSNDKTSFSEKNYLSSIEKNTITNQGESQCEFFTL